MKLSFNLILIFGWLVQLAAGTDYYLDADNGNDNSDGTKNTSAFRSLERINKLALMPGDSIHIMPGTEYHGSLKLTGSGTEQAPIRLFTEPGGPQATIHGDGASEAVLLQNGQYWEISNISITNKGPARVNYIAGLRVMLRDFGTAQHICLKNLTITDIYGSLDKNTEGNGILIRNAAGPKRIASRFDDLRVENCTLTRTDRNGICMQSDFIDRQRNWLASTNVVIRGNTIRDCGGDAIKPWGCDGALVEYNFVDGCRMRCEDYAAGIWPWSCDNTVIQYNQVCNARGTKDGQGFDSDYNCRNTVIQFNYSHDNEGGFLLVCGPAYSNSNIGCLNTIVRFNLSVNDGLTTSRIFHISGGSVKNTWICYNVIYRNKTDSIPLAIFSDWDGFASDTYFTNNIFYLAGQTYCQLDKSNNTIFANNLFLGKYPEQMTKFEKNNIK